MQNERPWAEETAGANAKWEKQTRTFEKLKEEARVGDAE